MHALVLLCINQHIKFEAPSFTDSKDMIGAKFKTSSSALADKPARRAASGLTAKFQNSHVTITTPFCW